MEENEIMLKRGKTSLTRVRAKIHTLVQCKKYESQAGEVMLEVQCVPCKH